MNLEAPFLFLHTIFSSALLHLSSGLLLSVSPLFFFVFCVFCNPVILVVALCSSSSTSSYENNSQSSLILASVESSSCCSSSSYGKNSNKLLFLFLSNSSSLLLLFFPLTSFILPIPYPFHPPPPSPSSSLLFLFPFPHLFTNIHPFHPSPSSYACFPSCFCSSFSFLTHLPSSSSYSTTCRRAPRQTHKKAGRAEPPRGAGSRGRLSHDYKKKDLVTGQREGVRQRR